MSPKRVHFPDTTPQQRKLLFETWQSGSSVIEACRKAHVGRGTFYRWLPRFEAEGYAGLERYQKKGPEKGFGRTAEDVENQVIEMRDSHADWGKHRIAGEIAKANNWVPLVSPNTVRRILQEAGQLKPEETKRKKGTFKTVARTTDEPGQAINIDLCFVPASHAAKVKLPAVSGSSSYLVVERPEDESEAHYPGRIFEDPSLSYAEAMQAFVAASA